MFSQVTGYCEGFSSNDLNLQMIGNVPQVWFNENMVSAKYVVESAKLQALKSVIS